MEFKKATFSECPTLVENEGAQVRINFDAEERTITNEDESTQVVYDAYVVRVAHPVTRDKVIDAIVTAAYPSDVMQAIINNHLLDSSDEEHEAEFSAMQDWRTKAKEVASNVITTMNS